MRTEKANAAPLLSHPAELPAMVKPPNTVHTQAEALDLLLSAESISRKVKRYFGGVNSRGAFIENDTGARSACVREEAPMGCGWATAEFVRHTCKTPRRPCAAPLGRFPGAPC